MRQHELEVLGELRRDSRKSAAGISQRTGIPVAAVFSCIKRLEKAFIRRYTSIIDFQRLGIFVRVNFSLIGGDDRMLEFLKHCSNVNSIYKLNSGFYIETLFPDLKAMYGFVEELEHYDPDSIEEHHVIEDIVRENMFQNIRKNQTSDTAE